MIANFAPVKSRPRFTERKVNFLQMRPIHSDADARKEYRRQTKRLGAAWNQLLYELRTPAKARGPELLGATAASWRLYRTAKAEAWRLRRLWRAWMGTDPTRPWGAEPYASRSGPSTGQVEARTRYYDKISTHYTVTYNGLFKDWGLTFESLTTTEQTYYVAEIQYRVDNPGEFQTPATADYLPSDESQAHEEGVQRTHGAPISTGTIDAAALKTYARGPATPEKEGNFMQYLPAVGIGLTAFKLFFSR